MTESQADSGTDSLPPKGDEPSAMPSKDSANDPHHDATYSPSMIEPNLNDTVSQGVNPMNPPSAEENMAANEAIDL